ncbi:hypothetical protein Bca4012_028355 [Brassica carinata]
MRKTSIVAAFPFNCEVLMHVNLSVVRMILLQLHDESVDIIVIFHLDVCGDLRDSHLRQDSSNPLFTFQLLLDPVTGTYNICIYCL